MEQMRHGRIVLRTKVAVRRNERGMSHKSRIRERTLSPEAWIDDPSS
jgi:hypothetical protein